MSNATQTPPTPGDTSAGRATCPRCGGDPAGAVWCPRCGLNLRRRVPPPPRARTTAEIPSRAPLFVGGAVAAAIVVGVVLAIVLSGGHSATPVPRHGSPAVPRSTPTPSPTAPEAPAVTAAAMHNVLNAYAAAYGAEDLDRLRSLFAAGLVRQNGSDPPQGLADALNTYAGQFAQLSNPRYELTGLQYEEGATAGKAFGSYRITDDTGVDTSGQIGFRFTAADGSLRIDRILIGPAS